MTESIVLYITNDVYEFVYDLLNNASQNEHFITCIGFIAYNIVL